MLDIKVLYNNEYKSLELGSLKGIAIKQRSELFSMEKTEIFYTVPFSIPQTGNNNMLLSYFNSNAKKINEGVEMEAQIFFGDLLWKEGWFSCTAVAKKNYNCKILIDTGSFSWRAKDVKMNEVTYKEPQTWTNKRDYSPETDDYCLVPIINNKKFSEETWYQPPILNQNLINLWIPITGLFADATTVTFDINQLSNILHLSTIVPFPWLHKIITLLLNSYGFVVKENQIELHPEYKNIFIYNNYSITTLDQEIYEPSHTELSYAFTINGYKHDKIDFKNHVPDMTIGDFILSLKKYMGVVFVIQNKNAKVLFLNDIINSPDYEEITSDYIFIKENKTILKTTKGINLQWTFDNNDEFLKNETITIDGVEHFINTNQLERVDYVIIKDSGQKENFIADEIAIYKREPVSPDAVLIGVQQILGVYLTVHPDYGQSGLNYFNYMKKPYNNEINPEVSPTAEISVWHYIFGEPLPVYRNYYAPAVCQEIRYWFNLLRTPQAPLRFLFYRGLKDVNYSVTETPNIIPTPYASFTAYTQGSYNDKFQCGNYSLDYWSDQGIYEKIWKDILAYKETIDVEYEGEMLLTPLQIKNFDFSKKYKIDDALYFITEMDINIKRNSIEPVKFKAIKAWSASGILFSGGIKTEDDKFIKTEDDKFIITENS